MDTGEIRRRVTRTIADAKAGAAARRKRAAVAEDAGRDVLARLVTPIARTVAAAVTAEGYRCSISTPAGAVRLSFESSRESYIEVALDTASDPPALVVRTARARGSRVISDEQIIAVHPAIAELGDDDLLACLLRELTPFVER